MNPRTAASVLAASLALGVLGGTTAAADPSTPGCVPIQSRATHGSAAITTLGARLADVAHRNQMSAQRLRGLLASDPTLWLDVCGQVYYVDHAAGSASATTVSLSTPFPYDQTFLLHSKPGSSRTIYLDFTGTTISSSYGGAWLSDLGGGTVAVGGYDTDSDPTTFSAGEQDVIQDVWQRVAEDYAPFDVDVTTQPPAAGALERTDSSDSVYGATAVITSDATTYADICPTKCGGIAYLNAFDLTGSSHESMQPAWVFTPDLGGGLVAKYLAEAASHEIGHNLGLSHDGVRDSFGGVTEYYAGSSGWAPIMGAGYGQPITQWSKGEYPFASNTEDDFAVMRSHGALVRTDEDDNTSAKARPITLASPTIGGVIATPADIDWVAFTPADSGNYRFSATPAESSPDLDIKLDVYSPTLSLLTSSNPPIALVSEDVATGLDAVADVALTGGQKYYIKVDGVGQGTWAAYGYGDYGSLGAYTVAVTPVGVPGAPVLDAASASLTSLALSWSTPADNGSAIDDYRYRYSSDDGANWSLPTPLGSSDQSTTVTGLATGQWYVAQVAAHNSSGWGKWGQSASVLLADPPPAPVVAAAVMSSTTLNLTAEWNMPGTYSGPTVTGFRYQYSSDAGTTWSPGTAVVTTGLKVAITGLGAGPTYVVRVSANNGAGWGAWGQSGPVMLVGAPGVPVPAAAKASRTAMSVTWTAAANGAAIDTYRLRYSSAGGLTWLPDPVLELSDTSTTLTGLTTGLPYVVQVQAHNAYGWSSWGTAAALLLADTPGMVSSFVAKSKVRKKIAVTWRAPVDNGGSSVIYYVVTVRRVGKQAVTQQVSSTALLATKLTSKKVYTVTVAACNLVGCGTPRSALVKVK